MGWKQVFTADNLSAEITLGNLILSTIISFFWMTTIFISGVHLWQRQPAKRWGKWTYIVAMSVALGGFWMLVFYPALMSVDSLYQWGQALEGKYHSWHPIGSTILMRAVKIST